MAAPDKLTIETPEQISIEYSLASAGSRFLAVAIDTLLQVAVMLLLGGAALAALAIAGVTNPGLGPWLMAVVVLVWFIVFYGYFALFEAIWNGQTPGKRFVGLRVVTLSGRPITALEAILRNLVRIVDQIPVIYAVGLVSVFMTARSQRLGDLAAGTVVVHEQPLGRRDQASAAAMLSSVPRGARKLNPNEIEAMEVFLRRREDLPTGIRSRTARDLASHVRARLTIPTEQAQTDERLLEELVAEYRSGGRSR